MGEGQGGGGQNEFSPPPLHPLPPREGRFLGNLAQILEGNSQIEHIRM